MSKVNEISAFRLEHIIASVPGCVYWKNREGQYLGCNDAAAELLGISKEEIVGKDDYFLAEKLGWPKSAVNTIQEIDKKIINTGEPILEFEEAPFLDKNGKIIHQITSKSPLRDTKGNIVGLIGNSINILQRKKNEKKLRQAMKANERENARKLSNLANLHKEIVGHANVYDHVEDYVESIRYYLESIIACMPGNVYWMDNNSVYLGCNDNVAKMLGMRSRKEIVGKTYNDMATLIDWSQGQGESFRKSDIEVVATGEPKLNIEEPPIQDAEGNVIYFLTSRVPIKNKLNQVIGLVGISIDITERKKMEEVLRKAKIAAEAASLAKSEFIANISHDIRTPLTGIITFSRFLKEQDKVSDAERKELAGDAYNASEQLLNLLNGVLDIVSASTATDNDVFHNAFDLFQMLEEIIQLEKPAVKSRHLGLKKSIDKNLPRFVVGDKTKVHRILLNLIGNAIKFTEKGYIKLSAELQSKDEEKATIIFAVEDTGIGIPDEAQSQIFERFFKVKASYKGKYSGNGIGLHIVQKYAQLLGGKIRFHSTVGKGTTFFITLTFLIGEPLKEESEDKLYKEILKQEQEEIFLENQAFSASSVTAIVDHLESKIKILLVEDSPSALKALKVLLIPYKFHVLETQNAEDAFELVKKEVFDLIITDIGLPEMQGDELVAEIRQLEKAEGRPRRRIVALTGHALGDEELVVNCKKVGIDELFQKPMQPKILKDLLDEVVNERNEKAESISVPKQPKDNHSPSKKGKLGVDLPDTEEQLFEIDHHPLLDLKVGESVLGSEELTREILRDFDKDCIVPDLEKIKMAHTTGDWDTVRALAHKIKGGATFGTVRLFHALLYMERYIKAGHTHCAEALYSQMLRVIDETVDYLNKHL